MSQGEDVLENREIQRMEFIRIQEGSHYCGKDCAECPNDAEFEYGIWFSRQSDREPDDSGALCGACAAVILLQESGNSNVTLEKRGNVIRAKR
jgi:hypothetical protein